jgi:hypothetical protein
MRALCLMLSLWTIGVRADGLNGAQIAIIITGSIIGAILMAGVIIGVLARCRRDPYFDAAVVPAEVRERGPLRRPSLGS